MNDFGVFRNAASSAIRLPQVLAHAPPHCTFQEDSFIFFYHVQVFPL